LRAAATNMAVRLPHNAHSAARLPAICHQDTAHREREIK